MKRLHFDYYMQIDYSVEVAKCYFTIKCFPKNNCRQRIDSVEIEMFPPAKYSNGVDGLGNSQIYGVNGTPHKQFYFRVSGEATVGVAAYEEEVNDDIAMIFKHPYGMNVAGEGIKKYYELVKPDSDLDILSKAECLMHKLHAHFKYEANRTDVNTSAEEAFLQGCGVCQDYSHIFIALLHLAGIPARYVTGLIVGEGASHAWVEVLHKNRWYGFDPTNDVRISDEQIKLSVGRDAHDCMINRGIMHGGGLHTQTIRVNVKEI